MSGIAGGEDPEGDLRMVGIQIIHQFGRIYNDGFTEDDLLWKWTEGATRPES